MDAKLLGQIVDMSAEERSELMSRPSVRLAQENYWAAHRAGFGLPGGEWAVMHDSSAAAYHSVIRAEINMKVSS